MFKKVFFQTIPIVSEVTNETEMLKCIQELHKEDSKARREFIVNEVEKQAQAAQIGLDLLLKRQN